MNNKRITRSNTKSKRATQNKRGGRVTGDLDPSEAKVVVDQTSNLDMKDTTRNLQKVVEGGNTLMGILALINISPTPS